VVSTHVHGDHIGGNEAISKAGRTRAGGNVIGDLGAAATNTAGIIAHENVLKRLSMDPPAGQQPVPFGNWPTETFFNNKREFLFNGEAVQIIHQPDAHTDGDSIVFFRKSDVVATGDLFTTVMYPFIDVANGGTINGYIKALNAIMDITVPSNVNEGGTLVVPGHGRLSDEQDVIEYRDMATIVRDRIREYVKREMTLDQIKAKKPTFDFDARYGNDSGFWTTAMFVETIYKEMVKEHPPKAPAKGDQRNRTQKGSGK
jgi:glyoxylase-like metal-dependent hydrolase (beta-lactamase superfamily II)